MKIEIKSEPTQSAEKDARRAKRVILWVMALFIILPFVLIWASGSFKF